GGLWNGLPSGGLLAFELEGELFFGAQEELAKHLATVEQVARGDVRVVVLVLGRGRNADAAFLDQLRALEKSLRARGIDLLLHDFPRVLTAAVSVSVLPSLLPPPDRAGA